MASPQQSQSSKRRPQPPKPDWPQYGDVPPKTSAPSTWPDEKAMTATSNNPVNAKCPFGSSQPTVYGPSMTTGNIYDIDPTSSYSYTTQKPPESHFQFTRGSPPCTDVTPRQYGTPAGNYATVGQPKAQQAGQYYPTSRGSASERIWCQKYDRYYKLSYDSKGEETVVWL